MPEVRIYKIDLSAGDFSIAGDNHSTDWGGTDPPISGYPELGIAENILRAENAGASSQHVIDAVDTGDYAISWIVLCGIGNLSGDLYDVRGGGAGMPLKVRWKQFFKSSALAESGVCYPLVLTIAGTGHGTFSVDRFFWLRALQTSGAIFDWQARYLRPTGSSSFSGFSLTQINGSSDTADDAEHEIIVTLVPSTVTGSYAGDGTLGSASIASDGSFTVAVDGSTVVSGSSLQFAINYRATSNPAVYYGKTLWHGD